MYGLEFADKRRHHIFPEYNEVEAVSPIAIRSISPLVWQEHCVECAMPACYHTCAHYKKRADGRCRLFEYGIERFENKKAILGQNVVIDMNEWAKLETFFYTSGVSYENAKKINSHIVALGKLAQTFNIGFFKRFCYYIKEFYIRKIGDKNDSVPQLFLCEIVNEKSEYVLNLENKANEEIVYRTSLNVKQGFNRFIIPTQDMNIKSGCRNYLYLYPEGNGPQLINIVSLEIVSIKADFLEQYFPKSAKKVKCVIWDLDNTLWDGILGEDGMDRIVLREEMIDIIKSLDAKGIINSIASKNNEDIAVKALKNFGIFEYFVCPQINWNAKSQNIKNIAETLDLGMDTFVFVDDSAFELNEVITNCPPIRTCNVHDIDNFIHNDCFDVPVTEDSMKRRVSYQEIAIRNKAAEGYSDNIVDFLKSCNMVADIAHPSEHEITRCYELLQRTNQLNISGERLTMDELTSMVNSPRFDCYRIRVHDNFGDYGLVGFAVFDISGQYTVILKHFVFSCRAARKKLEQSFFEHMIVFYRNSGYKKLELVCRLTEKNKLMQQVLSESGLFDKIGENENSYILFRDLYESFEPLQIVKILQK